MCLLGVSYTGGVCWDYSYTTLKNSKRIAGYLSPNTGFVTFAGKTRLSMPVMTFAHEVGHSVGAQHDGTENECNPRKYMMASHTSTLPEDHQKTFSQCSKDYFTAELQRVVEV